MAVDEAVEQWRREGVRLGVGASAQLLAQLSAFIRAPLPEDVQAFYRAADGMPDDDTDGLVSFWPIRRIVSDPEVRAGSDERGAYRDIAFADVMISSWFFYFRVRSSSVSVYSENTGEELPSLSELLRRYLSDSDSLAI
jgi:hypothetical protein